MKRTSFSVSAVIPASPDEVYRAWTSSKGHAAMTGSPATASARVGGAFTAWEGYILGTNLELEPGRRIVQAWRTTDFPEDAPDSRLEVLLVPAKGGTKVTIRHGDIPPGKTTDYRRGWKDFYFIPMKAWFSSRA